MTNTTRTPDDGRNERQRQQQSQDTRRREPDDERERLLEEKPHDFIERTRPEDPSGRFGQQTRDNVNPNIPSGERGAGPGPIVQPESTSGGVAPPAAPTQHHTEEQELAIALHVPSINEPPGSNIMTGDAGPVELPPLVLSDISPDTLVVGSGTFPLTVTGSGFTPESVVVFNDLDVPTTFVSATELTGDCPVEAAASIVDVEVHRGEDMSDVLQFEFTAVALQSRGKREPLRKPAKGKKGKR